MQRTGIAIFKQRLRHVLIGLNADHLTDDARIFQLRRTQHPAQSGHKLTFAIPGHDDLDQMLAGLSVERLDLFQQHPRGRFKAPGNSLTASRRQVDGVR
ncbi:hypothetical protein DYGSA30_32770 [Dyella sp. GSA-30]|nr:hypothetical protein DYGSA30_32770 [Dyella sp. GSA-30]